MALAARAELVAEAQAPGEAVRAEPGDRLVGDLGGGRRVELPAVHVQAHAGARCDPGPGRRSSDFGSGHHNLGGSAVSERLGVPGGQHLLFFAAGEAEWRGAGCGLDLAA